MKVFITGGSGFIGTTVVSQFLKEGWDVLNLDLKSPNLPEHAQCWRQGDVRDLAMVSQTIGEFAPDYVLHMAAATGVDDPKLTAQHFDTNIDGVKNVIMAIDSQPSVKRAVFVSSLLVCRNGYVPKNDTDYCSPNAYGESKVIGEQIVRAWKSSGCDWTIVRPTSVWGPWFEHSYKKFFQLVSRGLYFQLGGMSNLIKPITFVGNTAFMMRTLLTASQEAAGGKTFYLADYPQVPVSSWAYTIRDVLNAPRVRTVPYWFLKFGAIVGDGCKALGWTDVPLSSFRLKNMMTGGIYPVEATKAVVGSLPYSLRDGVEQTVDWMRSKNLL